MTKIKDDQFENCGPFLEGRLVVEIRSSSGILLETIDLGKNAIMPRSRLVASRLFAQNLKSWTTTNFHADWTGYAGQDYLGGVDVGSYAYPFSAQISGLPANSIAQLSVFGGVPTDTDSLTGLVVNNQNVARAFHHGSVVPPGTDTNLLYALGITGMSFGNMGHLVDSSTLALDANDTSSFVLSGYNPAADNDLPTWPAEPYDAAAPTTDSGYRWPGGGTKSRYPNLHQPNAFDYEPVVNGIVPWGYAGLATVQDNQYSIFGAPTRAVYEGNTTLYSETARFPLDKDDGISFPDGNSVRYKVTIPADSELNQERNFGYGQRPRNWITEAGLITGENLIVQSPDQRVTPFDPTFAGVSNVYGGELTQNGTLGVGAYTALPKDYFTRLRDPNTATWFLDSYGQLDTTDNNTWNLFARKVFGVITKTQSVSYAFLWTISVG